MENMKKNYNCSLLFQRIFFIKGPLNLKQWISIVQSKLKDKAIKLLKNINNWLKNTN